MNGFGLMIEELSDAVRIALRGELDLAHVYAFDEELRRVEDARPACVILDLRELTFLDSTGLARLLAARRRAQRAGCRLLVVRGPAEVQRVFVLSSLEDAFELVDQPPLTAPSGLRRA